MPNVFHLAAGDQKHPAGLVPLSGGGSDANRVSERLTKLTDAAVILIVNTAISNEPALRG